MHRKMLTSFIVVLLYGFFLSGTSNAALTTIGTANYGANEYNLIWDNDNNGQSVIWLDYTHSKADWSSQRQWATTLDQALTFNIDPMYNVTWLGGWRLPNADNQGGTGTDSGYNILASEIGHLYYVELLNLGYVALDGTYPQPGWGLNNIGDFNELEASLYWFGTESIGDSDYGWKFNMNWGGLDVFPKTNEIKAMALRSGDVSIVPIPGSVWLLFFGVIGLIGLRRNHENSH